MEKTIRILGKQVKLVPQIKEGSCKGCYFNSDPEQHEPPKCTVNLTDYDNKYSKFLHYSNFYESCALIIIYVCT